MKVLPNQSKDIVVEESDKVKIKTLAKTWATLANKEETGLVGVDISEMGKSEKQAVSFEAVAPMDDEPVYSSADQAEIQGNIIPGFNKGFQHFLFFSFDDAKGARAFLKSIFPYISSMRESMDFRKVYRERRLLLGKKKTFMCATWLNIAFSRNGIAQLTSEDDAKAFGDAGFQLGMAKRSTYLGDPSSGKAAGNASNWKFGGPDHEADIVIVIASDHEDHCNGLVNVVKEEASRTGLDLIFEQEGRTLPDPLRGHEHFGFRDGVSQPGIRGRLSEENEDFITLRFLEDEAGDNRSAYFAKPGQLLIWPGQILLGEPRQSTENLFDKEVSYDPTFPEWARRGSYLVIRRLRQDVPAFWSFASLCAKELGLDSIEFASRLVGRWPSGAPMMRSPEEDNPALGSDEFANNHFLFDDDTSSSALKTIPGYDGDNFTPAEKDFLATVCPHFAHIRKVNPRDSVTDLGKPEDNLARMILRRGIPYGDPIIDKNKITKADEKADRGLMFLCYCSSIENQFEFLQRRWTNSPVQPNLDGFDPIIGQNGGSKDRKRFIDFPVKDGKRRRIHIESDFVIPTGGGYFFSPTIRAIQEKFLRENDFT